jgi:transcriptional regulator with XRE-family HTH domain
MQPCHDLCMTEQQALAVIPEWDLADRMRKALRQSGISVQEIAAYLDVSRTAVSSWINGRIQPSTQTLRLWAMQTGVSFEWLTEGVRCRGTGRPLRCAG